MYTEYTTKNLNEYNKIMKVIDCCETTVHFEIVKNMAETFANNCDFRLEKLRRRSWFGLRRSYYKEYKSYKESADIQVHSIVDECNDWAQQYQEWEATAAKQREEEKDKRPPKKDIVGFAKLFKKNKRSKRHG